MAPTQVFTKHSFTTLMQTTPGPDALQPLLPSVIVGVYKYAWLGEEDEPRAVQEQRRVLRHCQKYSHL